MIPKNFIAEKTKKRKLKNLENKIEQEPDLDFLVPATLLQDYTFVKKDVENPGVITEITDRNMLSAGINYTTFRKRDISKIYFAELEKHSGDPKWLELELTIFRGKETIKEYYEWIDEFSQGIENQVIVLIKNDFLVVIKYYNDVNDSGKLLPPSIKSLYKYYRGHGMKELEKVFILK